MSTHIPLTPTLPPLAPLHAAQVALAAARRRYDRRPGEATRRALERARVDLALVRRVR